MQRLLRPQLIYIQMINEWKKDIDKSLSLFLDETETRYGLNLISDTFFAGIKNFLQRKGKRIRPLLFLIAYQGYTKKKNLSYENLLRCSLSLELLHDFMLVHDDIIDKSALRRGKPTLHRLYNAKLNLSKTNDIGTNLSIVAGDFIFALSIEAFLSVEEDAARKQLALKKFAEAAAFTSAGEFIDVVDSSKSIEDIDENRIFLNYTFKTAKYTFECPLLTAAILTNTDKEELSKLSRMAIFFGQAFQLQDDLLAILATSREIGKSVLSDLAESKKTLPVWKAYENSNSAEKLILKKLLEKKRKNYRDLIKFKALIKKSGAQDYCLQKIKSLLKEGYGILSSLKMKKKSQRLLNNLLQELFSKIKNKI